MNSTSSRTCDFLVIGGGVVGINIATALRHTFSDARIFLIEKERAAGLHASGRNSGVIHAGFYYTADSLKAKLTRAGNLALTDYCERNKLPINKCGKLVVARNAGDLPQLDELLRRGAANGVPLENLTAAEAQSIEPRIKTFERAIFSPSTSSADPAAVIECMRRDAADAGVAILVNTGFVHTKNNEVETTNGKITAGYIVNAAGLYADQIARDFGFSENYRVLPFKGLYLYSDEPPNALRVHVYPVPDLRNPFLGVHFTVKTDGRLKIGPTAIPAFWREQYRAFDNFQFGEFVETLLRQAGLALSANFDFRSLALEELRKCSRKHLVQLASQLLTGVKLKDYNRWGEPGIRAQLLDIRSRKLVMDFVIEGDASSTHVLNAVSPGWTCAIPFARFVVDDLSRKL